MGSTGDSDGDGEAGAIERGDFTGLECSDVCLSATAAAAAGETSSGGVDRYKDTSRHTAVCVSCTLPSMLLMTLLSSLIVFTKLHGWLTFA